MEERWGYKTRKEGRTERNKNTALKCQIFPFDHNVKLLPFKDSTFQLTTKFFCIYIQNCHQLLGEGASNQAPLMPPTRV